MAPTKFTPKVRPTNRDLQEQVGELHDCVHAVDAKIGRVETGLKTTNGHLDRVDKGLKTANIQLAMLAEAMGVKLPTVDELKDGAAPRKVRRRLGGLSPWQVAALAIPAVTSGMALYKVLEPAVIAFLQVLHTGLMH